MSQTAVDSKGGKTAKMRMPVKFHLLLLLSIHYFSFLLLICVNLCNLRMESSDLKSNPQMSQINADERNLRVEIRRVPGTVFVEAALEEIESAG